MLVIIINEKSTLHPELNYDVHTCTTALPSPICLDLRRGGLDYEVYAALTDEWPKVPSSFLAAPSCTSALFYLIYLSSRRGFRGY
jgi:hypothetical protein